MFGENFKRKYALTHQGVQKGNILDSYSKYCCYGWYGYIIFAYESPYFPFDKKSS